jgi:hypothetical protein
MLSRWLLIMLIAGLIVGGLSPAAVALPEVPELPPATDLPSAEQTQESITKAVAFLLKDQNKNGSWGGPMDSLTTWSGSTWTNPESHRSWRVATTGLCVAALLDVADDEATLAAVDRAVDYLCASADVRRPSEWDTMNNWAYIYGLQGLVAAHAHARYAEDEPRRAAIREACQMHIKNLGRFQSLHGGWGYLEFDTPRTRRPQWGTSFMTASAVVALELARDQGITIEEPVVDRGVRVINHCRLANGAYTYHVRAIPYYGMEYIDQVKGSLCRITACQAALLLHGQEVPLADRRFGLNSFFKHHRFLDIAVLKPVPHENYYANSGYFYLYGHYYAALVIETMPKEDQLEYWPRLRQEIIKYQQPDGSIWDYDHHKYDKPYGVAFSLMALQRSLTSK